MRAFKLGILMSVAALLPSSRAEASCSATNDSGDVCNISCEVGQAEMCINAAGAGSPQCFCSGTPSESSYIQNILKGPAHAVVRSSAVSITRDIKPSTSLDAKPTLVTTDAAGKFAELLEKVGSVQVTRYHTERRSGPRFCTNHSGPGGAERLQMCAPTTIEVQVPTTTNEILQASNITVISRSDLSFGETRFQDLPDQLVSHYITFKNCGSKPDPYSPPSPSSSNLSVSMTRTSSVAFSKSFTHGGSTSVNAGFNIYAVRLGASITVSSSETIGTVNTSSEAETITSSGAASYVEPYGMKSLVGITAYKIGVYIPFHFTATLDADLSPNDRKLTKVSQLVDETKRTFDVDGVIISNLSSDGTIVYYAPQPVTQQDCKLPGVSSDVASSRLESWMLASSPIRQVPIVGRSRAR